MSNTEEPKSEIEEAEERRDRARLRAKDVANGQEYFGSATEYSMERAVDEAKAKSEKQANTDEDLESPA